MLFVSNVILDLGLYNDDVKQGLIKKKNVKMTNLIQLL